MEKNEFNFINDSGLSLQHIHQLYFSETVFKTMIEKSANFPSISSLQKNQNVIESLRKHKDIIEPLNKLFEEFREKEEECFFFYEKCEITNTLESLEKDTFGQLIFQNKYLSILNHTPYVLFLLAYFKIYAVPFLALLLPISMFFLPYILIKYIWNMPISFNTYKNMMKGMWFGESSNYMQILTTIITMGQSIYQPIQNAIHLNTIDKTISSLGKSVKEYINIIGKIETILKEKRINFPISQTLKEVPLDDIRRVFIELLEQPYLLTNTSIDIAKLEILWTISQNSRFTQVRVYQSKTPYFSADSIVDCNLSNNAIGSSIKIDKNQHFMLSGPNGGGKSSFLRGFLQTILLSHTFGYAIGTNIEISPFDYILSGLHIQDVPGKKSLFEKELCFARNVLYYNNPKYKGLILFDEIFHSTNPPDGIKTSNHFLRKLWSYKHCASIISTHVFEIIDNSPLFVKKICIPATRIDGNLHYTYKIEEGVCKESSVETIWLKKDWIA